MTDERLTELKSDLEHAVSHRDTLKAEIEKDLATLQHLASQVQQLNQKRKASAQPYKQATERVADLSSQIQAEHHRRDEEARKEAARKAEEEAVEVPVEALPDQD